MQLNYKQYGEGGTPLLILHGLFGSLDNWHTLANKFGEHFVVYTIDQRNHGKSPHSNEFNYDVLAADIQEFIKEHQLGKVSVLGHSMGGKTVMQFALTYPELVHKLLIADIAPRAYDVHHTREIEALKNMPIHDIMSRKQADELMSKDIPEMGTRLFLLKNLDRVGDGQYGWKMNLEGIVKHYSEVVKEIQSEQPFTKPTLFIKGALSRYIQEEKDGALISKLFPNSEIRTIKGAAHWLHAEKPTEFYEEVMKFLR